jgi:hypothetical protein
MLCECVNRESGLSKFIFLLAFRPSKCENEKNDIKSNARLLLFGFYYLRKEVINTCLRFGFSIFFYENFKHFTAVLYLKKFELDFPAAFY